MKYYKNLIDGAVVKKDTCPAGKWWREATEHEYKAYRTYINRIMGSLEKAVTSRSSLLKA